MTGFDYKKSLVFFRDKFVPFNNANVSIASSPVLYGLSIYTVFGVRWSKNRLLIFRLKEHYERLVSSAKIMDFDSFVKDWPWDKFQKTMLELLRRNNIQEDVLVRVTVFIDELVAGTKIHGLKNSLSAYVYPMGQILPAEGAHVCVSSWIRNPDNAIPSRAKVNGSYVNASLMKNEALLNGYDDAIAIDEYGHVSEGTVANLFIVRGKQLITPGQSTDILEGITRSSLIDVTSDLGIKVIERSIDRSELYICDEAFFCGSSARLTPVLSVDKRMIGNGEPGKITKKLLEVYDQTQLGKNKAYTGWLTTV